MRKIVLLAALMAAPAAADPPPSPQCGAAEKAEFSCTLSDSRSLTFCSTESTVRLILGSGPESLKVESAPGIFKYDRYTRPMTTYLSVAFEHEGSAWTVYDESEGDQRAAGLRIKSDPEQDLRCSEIQGSLMALENLLSES